MKKLKRWLAALVVGEFVTLRHKDKSFKKNIQKATSPLDKMKVIFDGLFEFNKSVVEDLQQTNLDQMKDKAIARFDKEAAVLEDKLTSRESDFAQRSDEKLPIYLMWLEDQFTKFEKKALAWTDKLVDDYELASTVDMFKKRINKARKWLAALEQKDSTSTKS